MMLETNTSAGPRAGRIRRLSAAVVLCLLPAAAASADVPHVPLLETADAWEALPPCAEPRGALLPNWARALAGSLPYTTAAMLELDAIYRTSGEFDPRLRAKLRHAAARGVHSAYGEAYAIADLRRYGADDAEVARLEDDARDMPPAERAALQFAHKMTVAAWTVADEEVAYLVEQFGERAVVAMVLQLAYSNFLDRLVLALGVPVEERGPLNPQRYGFEIPSSIAEIPQAARPDAAEAAHDEPVPDLTDAFGADWSSLAYEEMQQSLDRQRERAGRVSVPAWEDVIERLPPGLYPPDRPMKVKWSLVVLGHQPELGPAWLRCLRVFGQESQFDRVFAESIFWVITRSLQCFY
jgi:alkylhydroperoxidase family enzyme